MKAQLCEILGEGLLFTSPVVARLPPEEPEYDEDGEDVEEIEGEALGDPLADGIFDEYIGYVTSDLSGEQPRAYAWLTPRG